MEKETVSATVILALVADVLVVEIQNLVVVPKENNKIVLLVSSGDVEIVEETQAAIFT